MPRLRKLHLFCERFEPRSRFKSRLCLIVRVNVVLNRTVVVDSDWRFDNLCGSHLQSQSELYHVSWWVYTPVIDLIGQLRCDVIGRLSVKPWCYWLWLLIISNWCISIRLLSQLNSCLLLVKLSFSHSYFCLISSISRLYGAGNCWLRFSGVCSNQGGGVVVKTMLCARVQIRWVFVPGLTPVFQSSMSPSN